MKVRKMRPIYYLLKDKQPILVMDVLEWGREFENMDRQVALTYIGEDIKISTVFLGIDHGNGLSRHPILFETMVFGGKLDQAQKRCHTWDQAEFMHEKMVAEVILE